MNKEKISLIRSTMGDRYYILVLLIVTLILSGCEKEPTTGHLKLTVTYPEAVVENGMLYFIPVPGIDAEARLYEKQARCLGYKNAGFGIAHIGENSVQSLYVSLANEKGEILFEDIEAGEYYLTVYARQQYKYTQKYIEVPSGDTLRLNKDFTPEGAYFEDLEPWDYEMPEY